MYLRCTTAFAPYPISWLAPEGAVAVAVGYFLSKASVNFAYQSSMMIEVAGIAVIEVAGIGITVCLSYSYLFCGKMCW